MLNNFNSESVCTNPPCVCALQVTHAHTENEGAYKCNLVYQSSVRVLHVTHTQKIETNIIGIRTNIFEVGKTVRNTFLSGLHYVAL